MEDAIAIVMVFSIPLVAILGNYFLRYKRLQMEQLKQGLESNDRLTASTSGKVLDLELTVQRLEAENKSLHQRLQNLETIVTSVEWDQLTAEAAPSQLPPPADKTIS